MQGAEAEEGGEQRIDPAPPGRPGRRGVQHDVEADHLHQEIRPLIKEVAREAAARQARDQDGGNHRCRHGRDQNQARRRGLVAVGEADIEQQERGEERLVAEEDPEADIDEDGEQEFEHGIDHAADVGAGEPARRAVAAAIGRDQQEADAEETRDREIDDQDETCATHVL